MKGFYLQREKSGAQAFGNDTLEQESDNILKLLARFTSQTVIVHIMRCSLKWAIPLVLQQRPRTQT